MENGIEKLHTNRNIKPNQQIQFYSTDSYCSYISLDVWANQFQVDLVAMRKVANFRTTI